MMRVMKRPLTGASWQPGVLLLLLLILAPEASTTVTVLYHRPGQEASLPCGSFSPCSDVTWLYSKTPEQSQEVPPGPGQGSTMSLDSTCSLTISNVSAEDAGLYSCRRGVEVDRVHLSVLSISPPEPRTDGTVTLVCTLSRHSTLGPCDPGSIRWLDGTEVLLGQGDGYYVQQTNCVYVLSTKWPNRRYRCQYVEAGTVRIEADYTPDTGLVYMGAGAGVVLVVLLVFMAVLVTHKKRTKATEDVQQPADAVEGGVTYSTISLQQVPAQSQARPEETVTYSVIRCQTP